MLSYLREYSNISGSAGLTLTLITRTQGHITHGSTYYTYKFSSWLSLLTHWHLLPYIRALGSYLLVFVAFFRLGCSYSSIYIVTMMTMMNPHDANRVANWVLGGWRAASSTMLYFAYDKFLSNMVARADPPTPLTFKDPSIMRS